MKVVHLSASTRGGAGIAAYRLHESLLLNGIDSQFLCRDCHPSTELKNVYAINDVYPAHLKLLSRLKHYLERSGLATTSNAGYSQKYLQNRPEGYEYFSFPFSNLYIEQTELIKSADIIHVHWIADGFINYSSFFRSLTGKKMVWTLHDMNPFTGGCHHSDGCMGFTASCTYCPQLPVKYRAALASHMLEEKIIAFAGNSIAIVSPSAWLTENSRKSAAFSRFPQSTIPNPVDEKVFYPMDKAASRKELGLPPDKKIILFVSHNINHPRKGIADLLAAFDDIRDDNTLLCAIGTGEYTLAGIHSLGYISGDSMMAKAYSAADVFVLPSLAENYPNTIVESLLCGTPVVASNTGGIPEQVDAGDGILIRPADVAGLASAIKSVIEGDDYKQADIRKRAVARFDAGQAVAQYISLYRTTAGK